MVMRQGLRLIEGVAMGMHKANHALCNEIDRVLAPYAGRRLSSMEATSPPHKALYGWEVDAQTTIDGEPIILWLLFYGDINKTLPKVFVASPLIEPLRIPHLEANGRLCVWPSRFIVDLDNTGYVEEILNDAVYLLREAVSGSIDSHFEEEFQSYWIFHCLGDIECVSILEPSNLSSRVVSVRTLAGNRFVYADSDEEIVSWMDNQGKLPRKKGKKRDRLIERIDQSAIIFFDRAIQPNEYPNRASDLYKLLISEFGRDADDVLAKVASALANKCVGVPSVLLSFPSSSGRSVVGLIFSRGIFSRHNRRAVSDGFRDHIPLKHVLDRTSDIRTHGALVSRADPAWTLGRDSNEKREVLSGHSVAIVGCGSLGASIAKLLVKSGVGKLILIDNEILLPENISRHELGYDYVGKKKVGALREKLSKEFPHVEVGGFDLELKEDAAVKEILSDSDLVLSCTGDWYADNALLEMQKKELFPLVFAFVESHACAGHVVVNMPEDEAYRALHICSGDQIGMLSTPITNWNEETLVRMPACAGEFQPYGAVEIGYVHSLAAKKVLSIILAGDDDPVSSSHTVWLGDTEEIEALDGRWNPDWERGCCEIGLGNKVVERRYDNGEWHCRCAND